jgi:hypothetical protein
VKRRSKAVALPATFEEGRALAFAREWLTVARAVNFLNVGDPFNDDAMHALVRRSLKNLAAWHPRNAARVVQFALAGIEEADQALKDLISETNARREPLPHALATYADILGNQGSPKYRRPEGRQRGNFLANFVIVCLMLELQRHFGLPIKRRTSRRPSCCSVGSQALIEIGLNRGSEDAMWKIWRDYGPPVVPYGR